MFENWNGRIECTRISGNELSVEMQAGRVWVDENYCLLAGAVHSLEEGLECCGSEVVAFVVR